MPLCKSHICIEENMLTFKEPIIGSTSFTQLQIVPKKLYNLILIARNLLNQLYNYISEENKKNEVDELAENVSLLYRKELFTSNSNYEKIDGFTILEMIEKLAHSKVKDYKSLTNKTIFKFMDMVEM